jgi:hypothetical protein
MFVFTRVISTIIAFASLAATSAALAESPSRAPGLWVLESRDNPHANWSMCVDGSVGDFIDTDVWKNFRQECKVTSFHESETESVLKADCKLDDDSNVAMTLTYSGDFKKSYRFESVTSFTALGEQVTQAIEAVATFRGECPAELKPGMKKMQRTGIIISK